MALEQAYQLTCRPLSPEAIRLVPSVSTVGLFSPLPSTTSIPKLSSAHVDEGLAFHDLQLGCIRVPQVRYHNQYLSPLSHPHLFLENELLLRSPGSSTAKHSAATYKVSGTQLLLPLCEEIFWDTTIVFSENMTLECVYPLTGILSQAEWFKISATKRESMAIFHPSFGVIIRKPYANRVYFLNSTLSATDMTLSFYNASEADIGFYSCYLHTFPFGPWEKVIQVVQSGNFELAGPSDKDLVTNPGNNITLSYQLKREQPMQIVTWEKIQPHQIDLLTFCNLSKGKSYVSKQQRPIMTNCSQGMTSSFIAFSYLTASDSGLYRCCFESSTGEKETFLIRLMVTNAEGEWSMEANEGAVLKRA
ncbi:CD226 antigen [Rhynchocyon petersi]